MERTQFWAVPGNTCCDAIEGSVSINTRLPTHAVFASACGNDILRGLSSDDVIRNGKDMIDYYSGLWPSTRKVLVDVHPSRVGFANTMKTTTNAALRKYAEGVGWCTVQTKFVFNKNEGEAADESQMLTGDNVHYRVPGLNSVEARNLANYDMNRGIRQKILDCGVEL